MLDSLYRNVNNQSDSELLQKDLTNLENWGKDLADEVGTPESTDNLEDVYVIPFKALRNLLLSIS
jgi:hypothetical protein